MTKRSKLQDERLKVLKEKSELLHAKEEIKIIAASHLLDISKIDLSNRPPIKPIINPFVLMRKILYTYAKAKAGKTWWVLWNTINIAAGRSYHLFEVFQKRILYIDGEMTVDEMVARMNTICAANKIEIPEGQFIIYSKDEFPNDFIYPRRPKFAKMILELAKDFDVIVFDNLSSLFGSGSFGEKDDRYFGPMREIFSSLKSQGKTVWFLHHEGKSSETSRGSSNIDDGVDGCMRLEKIETENPKEFSFKVNFRIYRSASEDRFLPLGVKVTEEGVFKFFDPGKTQEDLIYELYVVKKMSYRAIEAMLGVDKSRVLRLIHKRGWLRDGEK